MEYITDWTNNHWVEVVAIVVVTLFIYYIGSIIVSKLIKKGVDAASRRHSLHHKDSEKRQRTLVALFRNVWKAVVFTAGTLALFSVFFPDVSFAPLFASAGIVGVALGFGAQSLVKDFLSGIFIISENQYRVGDIIEIDGASGTVERIGTRSTVLRDADGNVHYFPNGMVQHVVNKTMGYSIARFSLNVPASTDIDQVVKIINDTGAKLAGEAKWEQKILKPPAFVSIGEFTSSEVTLMVSGKTQPSDQWSVIAEMRRRLLLEFEKKQIVIGSSNASSGKKKK